MNQCVPSWDLDDVTPSSRIPLRSRSNSNIAPDVALIDYEVAELTWENGQIAMHGLGPPRVPTNNNKHLASTSAACRYAPSSWEKPRASGTLESIVNQAVRPSLAPAPEPKTSAEEVVAWYNSATANMAKNLNTDARVPCGAVLGSFTQVASCSGTAARVPAGSVSATTGTMSLDRRGAGSPENVSSGKPSTKSAADDHDSVSHSRLQRESGDEEEEEDKKKDKSSVSTKRSRAAAIHNQSERKRRDKINQRMKTLQKLVPNSSKTDKASMLDEVIEYLKQLQAQVQMMGRMNVPAMMLPMAMQQQLQLSMMSPMGMGMGMGLGMGMGMEINPMVRSNLAGMPPMLPPNPFMPMVPWDGATATADARLQPQLAAAPQDPLSSFFSCQSQPMTPEAYHRMAVMYQQLHQSPASNSKS